MKRRDSIKSIAIGAGALAVLPSWAHAWKKESLPSGKIFSIVENDVLTAVADTFIPAKDGLGAVPLGVQDYLNRLFAECYDTNTQKNIRVFLDNLNASGNLIHGKGFAACSQLQREGILEEFAISEDKSLQDTYKLVKYETIRGFRTSEVVMVKYLDYKVAPGHYEGCAEVEQNQQDESD